MRATSENGEWWQMVAKWRMVAIRIPSRLKKPRTNTERLIDSTQDHSSSSSRSQTFFKVSVLKDFAIFTVKRLFWGLYLINLLPSGLQLY